MVMNDVVAAMLAPVSGEWIFSKPKRTMLSRAANRMAAVRGYNRSRVRQVFVAPFQVSATMPLTIESVPRIFVRLGRSSRDETARMVAKSGVLLVRHEVIDAPMRSMPLKIKKQATPGTKTPTRTNIKLAGLQRSIHSENART